MPLVGTEGEVLFQAAFHHGLPLVRRTFLFGMVWRKVLPACLPTGSERFKLDATRPPAAGGFRGKKPARLVGVTAEMAVSMSHFLSDLVPFFKNGL